VVDILEEVALGVVMYNLEVVPLEAYQVFLWMVL
jgi:hypothetical protein